MTRTVLLAPIATLTVVAILVGCGPSAAPPAATPTTAARPTTAAPTAPAASPTTPTTPTAASPTAAPASPSPAGNAQNGQAIYNTNCNACHPGGKQGVGPAVIGVADQQITSIVRSGKGAMPAFGPDKISDQQMQDLLAYIHTLR
ncbi:MAG: cytochrome c [Chloroflexota bacterium]|nr:MAG: cytochrome c [Chloroflexota bacterium]